MIIITIVMLTFIITPLMMMMVIITILLTIIITILLTMIILHGNRPTGHILTDRCQLLPLAINRPSTVWMGVSEGKE